MDREYYTYIIASKKRGTLYVGSTNNLSRRIWEHKHEINEGFSKGYNIKKLVYYESFLVYAQAAQREKRLKRWLRAWKIELIESSNPNWKDLYGTLCG